MYARSIGEPLEVQAIHQAKSAKPATPKEGLVPQTSAVTPAETAITGRASIQEIFIFSPGARAGEIANHIVECRHRDRFFTRNLQPKLLLDRHQDFHRLQIVHLQILIEP